MFQDNLTYKEFVESPLIKLLDETIAQLGGHQHTLQCLALMSYRSDAVRLVVNLGVNTDGLTNNER